MPSVKLAWKVVLSFLAHSPPSCTDPKKEDHKETSVSPAWMADTSQSTQADGCSEKT